METVDSMTLLCVGNSKSIQAALLLLWDLAWHLRAWHALLNEPYAKGRQVVTPCTQKINKYIYI